MPQILFMLYTTGAINQIYGIIGIGALVIFFWQVMQVKNVFINALSAPSMLILVVFCWLYTAIGELSISGILYYFVCPLIAFAIGWVSVEADRRHINKEDVIKMIIYFMIVGYAIHALVNYITNIGHLRWQLKDFFTGERAGATGSGSINTMVFSLSMYFLFLEKNKLYKGLGIVFSVISLVYALLLGTRAQILILLVVSVAFLLFYFMEAYGRTGGLRFIIVIAGVIGVCYLLYSRNTFNIRTIVESSNLIKRFQYGADLDRADHYRTSSLLRGFSLMFEYPLGGLKETQYYHNLWLDIGRVAGLFPFLIMLLYTAVINIHALRIIRHKELDPGFRYLILCVYLGIQMNFFFEPILEGLIGFFLTFTIVNGAVEYYYYREFLLSKDT